MIDVWYLDLVGMQQKGASGVGSEGEGEVESQLRHSVQLEAGAQIPRQHLDLVPWMYSQISLLISKTGYFPGMDSFPQNTWPCKICTPVA